MKTPTCGIAALVLAPVTLLLNLFIVQAAQAGVWATNNPMTIARYGHTATLLPNGKVLAAGGGYDVGFFSSTELYDPVTRRWTATGSMAENRAFHTGTLLPNGKVLVAGGLSSVGIYNHVSNGAELYDPSTGTWEVTGAIAHPRYSHTATLLPNGKVLIAGGGNLGNDLSSAEIYEPSTGTWMSAGGMAFARSDHTATLLSNGKVLVAGGLGLSSAELFNPATGTWTTTGSMTSARRLHTATMLPNGKVLVAGGINSSGVILSSAETYDPATGAWTAVGGMATVRSGFTATLLPNGKVLATGGSVAANIFTGSAELFQPSTGTWAIIPSMKLARVDHKATLLPDGRVLISGGLNRIGNSIDPTSSTELYVKASGIVTLTNLVQTYDGTTRSVFVATTPPALTVNVTYDGSASAPINAGSYTVVATIDDPDYSGSTTNTLIIRKAAGTVALSDLVQTYDGTAKSVSINTTPPGMAVNLTYNGSSSAPINAGDYTIVGTIDNPNYQGATTNTLVVGKAIGTVILDNLVQTYNGAARSVSVATVPAGLTVDVTYNGSIEAPTNAGSYTVIGTINEPNYFGSTTNTLVIGIWPVIIGQPASRTNNLGTVATFTVVADGTLPFFYQWRKNGTNYSDENSPILTFTNVEKSDEGLYSVVISNSFGVAASTEAKLTVNRPPIADATATLPLGIAVNGSNAAVVLDGSRSFDPDGDSLQYKWFDTNSATALTNGIIAVVTMPLGTNLITLMVSDGLASNSQTIVVEVITPVQAITRLIDATGDASAKQSLLATLRAALAAVNRSNPTAAINQLQAFQNQVNAQLGSIDPDTAQALIDEAQAIIDSITGTAIKSVKVSIVSKANGKAHLNFSGRSGQIYIIEASTDLVNWEKIGVANSQTNGDFIFEDANATNIPTRYYRVVAP